MPYTCFVDRRWSGSKLVLPRNYNEYKSVANSRNKDKCNHRILSIGVKLWIYQEVPFLYAPKTRNTVTSDLRQICHAPVIGSILTGSPQIRRVFRSSPLRRPCRLSGSNEGRGLVGLVVDEPDGRTRALDAHLSISVHPSTASDI